MVTGEPEYPLQALEALGPDGLRFHLAAIVDSSDDAILSKALDGTILSWNRAAQRLYGYSPEEVVGKSISVLVPDERSGEIADILSRIRAGERVEHFETERVAKDGGVVSVSLTISPIMDASGEVVAASTIARDTADRRSADGLRFHLAAIVDSSDDAILSKALDGTILSWNRAAQRLYGYSPEEVVGKSISVLVPDERSGEVADILSRIRAGERVDHFETERVAKDGGVISVSLTISPIKDASGKVVAASTIARDTTERKRIEAELEATRDQALEASRTKSEFLATMSHEIRTPMNGVIGMIGLLLDTELDREQRDYAETVRASGEALLSIINDILDFSKIEAGRVELDMVDFDLGTVIEEVAALLAERAHGKGLELATLVQPDLPTAVRGDPGRLRQVLTNLVGNAIKFTEAGEVVVRAEAADVSAGRVLVRFEVADTGIGIAPSAQDALFEPFAQADASTTRTYGGTGLGLTISDRLVERMGGKLEFESELGRGSTFSFTVGLARQAQPARVPVTKCELAGLRALVVDDNATNRTILEHQLASRRMHGTSVESGEAALAALGDARERGEPFHLALLDMEMPVMDGIDLARAIRRDPALDSIPLVLLTSSGLGGTAEQSRQAGISAYLTKPVRQSQLFDVIATVIGARTAPEAPSATRHTVPQEEAAGARPRLLVAEDNVVNQKVALAMLAKLGYRADVVSNGAEAVEAARGARYEAVLMDCQMPEMDGYDATRQIRSSERDADRVPIIAMTASVVQGEREKCLAAGMDDYISKPVAINALEAALERWAEPVARP